MKKFTKILVCLMLCVFGLGLVACDNRTTEEKNFTYPSKHDLIYGNGGLSVRKGNYVYFVNGYNSVNNITNKKDTYTVGALMLMKLGENGEVVTDNNGLLKDDYYITMHDKLCGYEATNLFISGNYLYFVSPCLENESGDKTWAKERVVFNRIKLDKTSDVEEVYSSGVKYNQLEYQYYEENGRLYILVWEKGDSYYSENGSNALIRVDATGKSSSKISNDVSGVVFADNHNEIFFSKKSSEDEYYYLKQYNIANNHVENYTSFDKDFEVKFVADGNVYISMAHERGSSTDIMVSKIEDKSGFELFYAYNDTLKLDVTSDGSALVAIKDNTISLITGVNNVKTITDEDAKTIEVIDYTNGCILYYDTTDENSNIKLVSYSNVLAGSEPEIKTLTSINTIDESYAYFDLNVEENYLYFYKMEGSNYYLNRIRVNNNIDETEEMFGVYLDSDVPEVEDEVVEEEE